MPRKNILLAMFDVRPKEGSAGFGFGEIEPKINLREKVQESQISRPDLKNPQGPTSMVHSGPIPNTRYKILDTKFVPKIEIDEDLFCQLPKPSSKEYVLEELERALAGSPAAVAELASYGGAIHQDNKKAKPRPKGIKPNRWQNINQAEKEEESEALASFDKEFGAFWPNVSERSAQQEILTELTKAETHSPTSREIEVWLENLKKSQPIVEPKFESKKQKFHGRQSRIWQKWSSWFRRNRYYVVAALVVGGLAFNFIYQNGIGARRNIVQNGSNAVANLEEAKKDLEEFRFIEAADRFALAYDDFNRASGTLSQMGTSFLSIFGSLPGLSKIKAANNLVEAGQSISKAGENLALAFSTLYKTNLLSFLDSDNKQNSRSISKILTEFRDVLIFAQKSIGRADHLLASIDTSVLPPDKQTVFIDFKEKVPEFQKYIGDAVDYSEFLLEVVGSSGAKTYLVLLQNNSELRPTGGFPGTYAVITFENGALKKIFVDDIYRLDAALRENIIPPKPLQHITPNWGLRDANWWADFPTSARKIAEFYKLDTGKEIGGILTITPTVIEKIFNIIGPIEMLEYGVTLDASNFLHEIQNEVEYEADRAAPKQIVSDLQPLFFERLSQQDKSKWIEIFKILLEAVEQKHVLAYFDNSRLEEIALKNGLGGEIKNPTGDYLQIVFSNIKGSKTDFVTSNTFQLESELGDDGSIGHRLQINRVHGGGNSKYGFYNRDNSAYVKVYVPLGSRLESIQGHSLTDYRPLIGHEDFGFKKDPDLAQVEGSVTRPFAGVDPVRGSPPTGPSGALSAGATSNGVDVFEESGKTVFGFWLITRPGQTKSVSLKYKIPPALVSALGAYNLIWQKQAGTKQDNVNFSFAVPDGQKIVRKSEGLDTIGNNLVLNSDLSVDREVDIEFK